MVDDWIPTERQKVALSSTADEVLFGGARGGGKTDSALRWFLYDIENPLYRGLVIRRNSTDLQDFMDRARLLYEPMGALVTGKPGTIKFPSGAVIYSGHLDGADAYTKYQGWEIHRLLMEEVTHIPSEELYEKLLGSVRSTVPGLKPQVFLTTNPGGVGHEWVKGRFRIDEVAPDTKFETEEGRTRIYVPASIYDNPHLLENDPSYVKYLESLPDTLRDQWLYGKWDDFMLDGAFFAETLNRAYDEDRVTFVPPNPQLPAYTAWDLGMSDATGIWTFQVDDKKDRVYILDYYEGDGMGLPAYVQHLRELSAKLNITILKSFLPHDIAVRELGTGQSREMSLRQLGVDVVKLPQTRDVFGDIELARNLIPKCFFNQQRTKDGLSALRSYRKEFNEKRQRYENKPLHDWTSHASDGFRYLAVAYWKYLAKNPIMRTGKIHKNTRKYK